VDAGPGDCDIHMAEMRKPCNSNQKISGQSPSCRPEYSMISLHSLHSLHKVFFLDEPSHGARGCQHDISADTIQQVLVL
jgi:hypothetical protein